MNIYIPLILKHFVHDTLYCDDHLAQEATHCWAALGELVFDLQLNQVRYVRFEGECLQFHNQKELTNDMPSVKLTEHYVTFKSFIETMMLKIKNICKISYQNILHSLRN